MMKTLLPEQTQQVSGGIARESSATAARRLQSGAGIQEIALTASTDSTNALDATRSFLPASIAPDVVAEDNAGVILRHRIVRFDANRLAPGDADIDDFNGFNDQGFGG